MKVAVSVELKPFMIPKWVTIDGSKPQMRAVPIGAVAREDLIKLCAQFEANVLNSAGFESRTEKRPINDTRRYDFEEEK